MKQANNAVEVRYF